MLLKQFRYDLTRGLGSIILYLKQSPKLTSRHIDAIFSACVKNTAYDPQCDINREDYLWEIIQLSQQSETLQERILETLENAANGWGLLQVFRLAKIFALNGNSTALAAMKRGFRYNEEWNNFIGGEEIIILEGEQGFLFTASRIGEHILSSDYEEDRALLNFAKEQLGEEKVAALLKNNCDANIRAFVQSTDCQYEDGEAPSNPNHFVTYEELKTSIGSVPDAYFRYTRWGMQASKEDLLRAANDLLEEKSTRKRLAYLYIFGKTIFPLDPQKIIDFSLSKNRRLRSAAIAVLSNIKDERIHQLGIQLMARQATEIDALDLFILNYSEDDLPLLEGSVFKKHTEHSFHSVGFSILKIFANNPTPSCRRILIELYNKGLCSFCRKRSIEAMMSNQVLPASIQDEIRYDCNPNIRNLINTSAGLP